MKVGDLRVDAFQSAIGSYSDSGKMMMKSQNSYETKCLEWNTEPIMEMHAAEKM